jgi:hypothetical protein
LQLLGASGGRRFSNVFAVRFSLSQEGNFARENFTTKKGLVWYCMYVGVVVYLTEALAIRRLQYPIIAVVYIVDVVVLIIIALL